MLILTSGLQNSLKKEGNRIRESWFWKRTWITCCTLLYGVILKFIWKWAFCLEKCWEQQNNRNIHTSIFRNFVCHTQFYFHTNFQVSRIFIVEKTKAEYCTSFGNRKDLFWRIFYDVHAFHINLMLVNTCFIPNPWNLNKKAFVNKIFLSVPLI